MNAFTIVNRRPSFSTAISAGSVRPQQMLPPGSPMFSHTAPVMPVGPEPVRVSAGNGPISTRRFGGGFRRVVPVSPVGPEPAPHLGLPIGSSFHISGPLEAMLPHLVE